MDAETTALIARLVREEEATNEDRLVAEMVSRGEEIPPSTPAQSRVYDPTSLPQPDFPEPDAVPVQATQRVEEKHSEIVENHDTSNLSPTIPQPDASYAMDTDTAALIAQLAFEDLGQILTGPKAKSSTDDDHLYASSWATALITDAAYLEALITAEEAAAHDRLAAEMLSRGEALPPQTLAQSRMENPAFNMHPDLAVTAAMISPAVQRFEKKSSGKEAVLSESPSNNTQVLHATLDWAPLEEYTDWNKNASVLANIQKPKSEFDYLSLAPGPSVNRNKWVQCTVCYDSLKYSDALQTPCDHNYCTSCVVSLVEKFTQDETFFPLRCCEKPIPTTDVDSFISPALRTTFAQKHAEFSVPSQDRIYCAEPTCSTFLGASARAAAAAAAADDGGGAGIIACPKCTRATCVRCRQPAHAGEDCAVHAGTVQLRALAQRERWQTCPGCGSVVELREGCYHMTCRCGTQFCYQCAARWKTCTC